MAEEQRANRLIILGNGFDLAHGMKTRYENFMLDYLTKLLTDDNFSCEYELFPTYSKLNRRKTYNELKTLIEISKKMNLIGVGNISYFLRSLLNSNPAKKWIDLEKLYYKFLTAEFTGKPLRFDTIDILNSDFEKLKNLLIDYLISLSNPKLSNNFDNIFYQEISAITKEKIEGIVQSIPQITLFLNFNYTNLAYRYYDIFTWKKDIINIHGQLNDPKNPIIFGYGDEMDNNYKLIEEKNENEYLKNFKTFQYSKTSNYHNLERFVESLPFEVFVIGHSCGLSDRVLLNYVFEHENCKSIKVYYHENEENYLNTVMDISRHFKNKQLVRSKVVPFDKSEPCPQWNDEELN